MKCAALGRLAMPSGDGSGRNSSDSHFLHAGQLFMSAEGKSVVVILGSCVAVCLWDPTSGIGGATHYLLPEWDGYGTSSARYGNVAIAGLLEQLTAAGANRTRLRAKVFGGGCLFDSLRTTASGKDDLASRNAEVAMRMLTKEHIPIDSTLVGMNCGLRISFHTGTGNSTVQKL